MSLRATGATRKGLGAGATRQLHGGPSARTGPRGGTSKFITGAKSGTRTDVSTVEKQLNIMLYDGKYQDCAPKPMYKKQEVIEEKVDPNKASKDKTTQLKGSGNEKV